jgi:hypothetical protein
MNYAGYYDTAQLNYLNAIGCPPLAKIPANDQGLLDYGLPWHVTPEEFLRGRSASGRTRELQTELQALGIPL